MVTVLGIAAAAWGVVMALAPILQIRRMLKRRSSEDVSLGYYAVLLPGFALWIAYGAARDDWALMVPNMVALTIGALTIAVALVIRRRVDRSAVVTTTASGAPTHDNYH
jgi:uncharacterized protein with PQ loop repeat